MFESCSLHQRVVVDFLPSTDEHSGLEAVFLQLLGVSSCACLPTSHTAHPTWSAVRHIDEQHLVVALLHCQLLSCSQPSMVGTPFQLLLALGSAHPGQYLQLLHLDEVVDTTGWRRLLSKGGLSSTGSLRTIGSAVRRSLPSCSLIFLCASSSPEWWSPIWFSSHRRRCLRSGTRIQPGPRSLHAPSTGLLHLTTCTL